MISNSSIISADNFARKIFIVLWTLLCGSFTIVHAVAQTDKTHGVKLETNQAYVEELARNSALKIDDIDSVFNYVLSSLPSRVKVYPTENYYYFSFHHNGMDYSGNLRLEIKSRDRGEVQFIYFKSFNGWRRDEKYHFKALSAKDGVKVEKVNNFAYKISYKTKAVLFELNDLSKVKPSKKIMHDDEIFIGPIFDESAIQFFLIYNPGQKVFLYVLNEGAPLADEFFKPKTAPHIFIGRRTGFAFYQDKNLDRKILVGVYGENSNVNNYLDGPFDQMPDNFIKDDRLKNALEDAHPAFKGKISRFGYLSQGEQRFAIGPYLYYTDIAALKMFHDCAVSKEMSGKFYYKCFDAEEANHPGTEPAPEKTPPLSNTVPTKK